MMPVNWWATMNLLLTGYESPATGEWVPGIRPRPGGSSSAACVALRTVKREGVKLPTSDIARTGRASFRTIRCACSAFTIAPLTRLTDLIVRETEVST